MSLLTPPKPPLSMIIKEGSTSFCPKCGSSTKFNWFRKQIKCIHPMCKNYYKKIK